MSNMNTGGIRMASRQHGMILSNFQNLIILELVGLTVGKLQEEHSMSIIKEKVDFFGNGSKALIRLWKYFKTYSYSYKIA